jgi:hypothetical protein
VDELLGHRQDERRSLARAGLGQADDVLPVRAMGMTAAWMGVGCTKPMASMVRMISGVSPSAEKDWSVVWTGCCGIAPVNIYRNTLT